MAKFHNFKDHEIRKSPETFKRGSKRLQGDGLNDRPKPPGIVGNNLRDMPVAPPFPDDGIAAKGPPSPENVRELKGSRRI